MAWDLSQGVEDLPMRAGPNASSNIKQYTAVKLDTGSGGADTDVVPAAANTDTVVGINQDVGGPTTTLGGAGADVTPGQSMRVRSFGVSRARVTASGCTRGDLLVVGDSAGRLQTAPALAATTVHIVGIALQTAANLDDVVPVLLTPYASSLANA